MSSANILNKLAFLSSNFIISSLLLHFLFDPAKSRQVNYLRHQYSSSNTFIFWGHQVYYCLIKKKKRRWKKINYYSFLVLFMFMYKLYLVFLFLFFSQLTETQSESSYYSPQKVKSKEVLCLEQEGITIEVSLQFPLSFVMQCIVVGLNGDRYEFYYTQLH